MYDKIMDLSLFKGINRETLSTFLEKTHLHFRNFQPGEKVIAPDEECDFVRCVIKGNAGICRSTVNGNITLTEIVGEGYFFGVERLFGLNRRYCMDVRAVTELSVIEFSKRQYVEFIKKNDILLINLLNMLSRICQRFEEVMLYEYEGTCISEITKLVEAFTSRESKGITVSYKGQDLQENISRTKGNERHILSSLIDRGIISVEGETISITDRCGFLQTINELSGSHDATGSDKLI